jgi:hypothetical protein
MLRFQPSFPTCNVSLLFHNKVTQHFAFLAEFKQLQQGVVAHFSLYIDGKEFFPNQGIHM